VLGVPGESVTAIGVDCPVCGRSGAVAQIMVGHDDRSGRTKRALVTFECPKGCQVDLTDSQTLVRLGLAD
jgi:hypothetical protein